MVGRFGCLHGGALSDLPWFLAALLDLAVGFTRGRPLPWYSNELCRVSSVIGEYLRHCDLDIEHSN